MVERDWEEIKDLECIADAGDVDPGSSIVTKRRLALAALVNSSEEAFQGRPVAEEWLGLKRRMIALFDFLERLGCFILRKGDVEAYYRYADRTAGTSNPELAVEEVEGFEQEDPDSLAEHYPEFVRALSQAASTEEIDEATALRGLLLAVGAPVLDLLGPGVQSSELNGLATRLLGEKANLFMLELASEGDGEEQVFSVLIELKSKVLDVTGFPIRLTKGSNINAEAARYIVPKGT